MWRLTLIILVITFLVLFFPILVPSANLIETASGVEPIPSPELSFMQVTEDGYIIKSSAPTKMEKQKSWMIQPTSGIYTTHFRPGHPGIDIANRSSPDVSAVADGVVTESRCGWNGGYGCLIKIDHTNGKQTLYAHLSKLYVVVGDTVVQGQPIAKMGHTGRVRGATGIHLHFEVTENNRRVDPLAYLE